MTVRVVGRLLIAFLAGMAVLLTTVSARQTCGTASTSDSIRLGVQSRSNNSLIADISVDLAVPAPIFVEYGNDQVGWLRTPTRPEASGHELPIVRMRAESTYKIRAFSVDGAGCPSAVAASEFTTGSVPGFFRVYAITTQGEPTLPLTLMDWPTAAPFIPPGAPGDRTRLLAALDQDGQVVWYYAFPPHYPHPPLEATAYPILQRADGNLYYMPAYYSIEEITPDGVLLQHLRSETPGASWPHHDLAELPDGRLVYLGAEDRVVDDGPNGGPADLLLRGDTLHVVNPQTGRQEKVWSAFDSLDPRRRLPEWDGQKISGVLDWTHANSVSVGARGNVLVSLRSLNQVISLSPDFKTIEWKVGGPDSSFTFEDPADQFHGQHGVVELPNGHLIMFDNGNYRPEGEYSRALELELNHQAKIARKVWEYRPQPDVFSDRLNNVVRLANGNTLVNFGWRELPDEPAFVVEVRPDGSVAYEQLMRGRGLRAVRYRVIPVASLAGEFSVSPTAAYLR